MIMPASTLKMSPTTKSSTRMVIDLFEFRKTETSCLCWSSYSLTSFYWQLYELIEVMVVIKMQVAKIVVPRIHLFPRIPVSLCATIRLKNEEAIKIFIIGSLKPFLTRLRML